MDELITHYGAIKKHTFFSELINLRQRGTIINHIQQFKKPSLMVKNISKDNLLDLFMGTLKGSIQHEVHLLRPKSLEYAFSPTRKVESKNMATRRVVMNNYRVNHVSSPNLTQLTRLKS
jgi:hypothetical protein